MRLDDFDFELPVELIAQTPVAERGASRMLHLDGTSGVITERKFRDIAELVASATSDGSGGTVVTHDEGSVTLVGINPATVSSDWFM